MATFQPVPSSDVDFQKYKKSLVDFLKTYPQFTDYDYEGSNLSVLIDLLTYNTYNFIHYDNMVGNEAWIDSAQLRSSLVSHGTDLSYLPRSRISAQCTLSVDVYTDDNPTSLILPRYYKFRATDQNNNTIYFMTNQDYTGEKVDTDHFVFNDIVVYQGELVDEYFNVSNVTIENGITTYETPFVISSSNVDITSLEVFVSPSESSPTEVKYTYAENLESTSNATTTYFLRGIYDDQYAVEFGDGVFGIPLTNGNIVHLRYRTTAGPVIQGNYALGKTTDISGYTNIIVSSISRVQGGFERESVEELRQNAPKYFQTQGRTVTATDYEVIIKKNFPQIQQVSAFGGEEIQQYGKVYIVLKPYGTTGVIPDFVKEQIISLLKLKNLVPEPIIIDPSYFYINITGNVFYNGDVAKLTDNQMKSNIIKKLTDLNNAPSQKEPNNIGDFNVDIFQSTINDTIKSADVAITGSDVTMTLIRHWNPGLNLNESLNFTTNNPLKTSLDGAYQIPNDYTITTTVFQIWYNNAMIDVIIQDDGLGNLFYYQVSTGEKIRIGTTIGTVDYTTGNVNLIANIYSYNGNQIAFYCLLANKSISMIRDCFALIDSADISLNLIRQ